MIIRMIAPVLVMFFLYWIFDYFIATVALMLEFAVGELKGVQDDY